MSAGADCGACGVRYPSAATGALDLRLRKPKVIRHEHVLGEPLPALPSTEYRELPEKHEPEVDFGELSVPHHLTRALMSHFPRAPRTGDLALDLGCGGAVHRPVCEAAGFEYVGLDYESDSAQVLGDAHALPFADQSFGFVLSIAVLEHIRFPFVAMREAFRVLRPGALFIGTVAFLEPFHGNSYFHHSHLGVLTSLLEGGFEIDCIAPHADWNALTAQANMGLFPKMPGVLQRLLIWPLQVLHRLWWAAGRRITPEATEAVRIRNLTGAFSFVARRPAVDSNTSVG
jgi:SAM-dependent methyltransferase